MKRLNMSKSIIVLFLSIVALSGCTVVVSDPHPRYVVREVEYEGSRPVEVYLSGGVYYYTPCAYVPLRYHNTRVSYYNSSSMRVVRYQRPADTVIIREASPRTNTVIIKEEPRRNNTVIIKEEPRRDTVIIKEQAPQRNNTVIIKEKENNAPRNNNRVIIKK